MSNHTSSWHTGKNRCVSNDPLRFIVSATALSALLMLLSLYIYGCAMDIHGGPSPKAPTTIQGYFLFPNSGSMASDEKIDFTGCFVGQFTTCQPQTATNHNQHFTAVVAKKVDPSKAASVMFSTVGDGGFVDPGFAPGKWRVSAFREGTAQSLTCEMLVAANTYTTFYFNFVKLDMLGGGTCSSVLPITTSTSFLVSTASTAILTHSPNQIVALNIQGGAIQLADPVTVLSMRISVGDVTVSGVTFGNIEIRSAGPAFIERRENPNGVPLSVIPAGTVPFEAIFTANGVPIQMVLLAPDMPVVVGPGRFRLEAHFEVALDPNNPLLPPFESLAEFLPFAADVSIVAVLEAPPPIPPAVPTMGAWGAVILVIALLISTAWRLQARKAGRR